MRKYSLLLLATFLGVLSLHAIEPTRNDTTVRFNKKVIHLEDSIGQMKVKVLDSDSLPYKPIYEGVFSDGKSYEKWTVMEAVGLQIPFLNKPSRKHSRSYSMEPHWAGIGLGFVNITDRNFKMNNIAGVSLKAESSKEFFVNLIEKILPIYRNNLGLTTGIGFDWHNYVLDMNKHLLEVNGVTSVYDAPAGVNYDFSRLKTFHITIPLLLEWQPTFGRNHNAFASIGAIAGINTYAAYKIKYKDANGNTMSATESKGLNTAPLSFDFYGQMGYGAFSVYAKYSPTSIFQSDKGPDLRAVSLGLMLNF